MIEAHTYSLFMFNDILIQLAICIKTFSWVIGTGPVDPRVMRPSRQNNMYPFWAFGVHIWDKKDKAL